MAGVLQSFADCLRRIEVRYGEAGWHGDENVDPALYSVHRTHDRLRPVRLGIGSDFWDLGPPGLVLEAIGDQLSRHPERLLAPFRAAPRWVGMALAMEAWYVDTTDPAKVPDVMRAADRRELRHHPQRQTMRVVYGITREQERCVLMHRQHLPGVEVYTEANFPGGVQEGLARLVAAIDELLEHG